MTLTIVAIVQLLAFILFVAAALEAPSRLNLIGAGLALWMFSLLISHV